MMVASHGGWSPAGSVKRKSGPMWVMRMDWPLMSKRILTWAECAPKVCSVVMNELLIPNARRYASLRQLEIGEPLGSGKDGIVLVSKPKQQPAKLAIKVHRFAELYVREKSVYERLQKLEIS